MNKITACCIALGTCSLALLPFLVFSASVTLQSYMTTHSRSLAQQASRPSVAAMAVAMATPTATPTLALAAAPIIAPAIDEVDEVATAVTPEVVLPIPTATEVAIEEVVEVAAAPALAPVPTPRLEATRVLSTKAVAADQSVSLPLAASNSAPQTCWVANPPSGLGLDPFYIKYCAAYGVPIVASGAVADLALQQAWQIVTSMLDSMVQAEEIKGSMARSAIRIGIIGVDQVTTDMPEHRDLYTLFPGIDWNSRTRAVGATQQIPLLSVAEENVLCQTGDLWAGKNILVHEFAHSIKNLGLDLVDPSFQTELQGAYQRALDAGLWADTYVASNIDEYWAEGVRIYFQIGPDANLPSNLAYAANTRAELQTYDPELYQIVGRVFSSDGRIPPCP